MSQSKLGSKHPYRFNDEIEEVKWAGHYSQAPGRDNSDVAGVLSRGLEKSLGPEYPDSNNLRGLTTVLVAYPEPRDARSADALAYFYSTLTPDQRSKLAREVKKQIGIQTEFQSKTITLRDGKLKRPDGKPYEKAAVQKVKEGINENQLKPSFEKKAQLLRLLAVLEFNGDVNKAQTIAAFVPSVEKFAALTKYFKSRPKCDAARSEPPIPVPTDKDFASVVHFDADASRYFETDSVGENFSKYKEGAQERASKIWLDP
jgi:hypothetical protein